MAIPKILAGASLVLLTLAVAPIAQAANADDGTTINRPQKTNDPAGKAAGHARHRHHRHDKQRQMQQPQGATPSASAGTASH